MDVNTSVRSFVCLVEGDLTTISPMLRWSSNIFRNGVINVRLWYKGQPQYCFSCHRYGHKQMNCNSYPPLTTTTSDQGATTASVYPPPPGLTKPSSHPADYYKETNFHVICDVVKNVVEASMITNKLKLSVDPANLPESYPDLLDCKFVTAAVKHKQDSPIQPKTPFWSKDFTNKAFSHFTRGQKPIEIWGESFPTPEHFLGVWRARILGDQNLAKQIKSLRYPNRVSYMSRPLRHLLGAAEWTWLSGELLAVANREKYTQWENFRTQLFMVEGDLVESNTGVGPWGCGVNSDDPRFHDEEKWPRDCFNLAGTDHHVCQTHSVHWCV